MNFLSHMLRVYQLIVIVKITNCYVLFAANLDDFRAVAKQFVPDQLADKLAQAVSDISLREALRAKDEDEYDTANDKTDGSEGDSDVYLKARDIGQEKGTKMNFEELVRKVKKRLEKEFKNKQRSKNIQDKLIDELTTQKVSPLMVKVKTTQRKHLSSPRQKEKLVTVATENAYVEAQPINEDIDYKETDPPVIIPAKTIKKIQGPGQSNIQPSIMYEFDTEKPQEVYPKIIKALDQNKQIIPKIKKVKTLKKTVQALPSVAPKEDEAMSFEKTMLVKKDSYEDYVTPEKETNIYVSKEKQMLVNKETRYKIQKNDPGNDKFNIHNKYTIKVKTMKEIDNPEVVKFVDTTVTTPEEMYYDETEKTVGSDEIQARTENLWFEFNDTKNKQQNIDAEEYNANKRGKIGTGFPTRARFTIYTPEYIKKTTPGAEKYNFDEPIPERDRVRENLKFFGDPVSKVNKKVRLF